MRLAKSNSMFQAQLALTACVTMALSGCGGDSGNTSSSDSSAPISVTLLHVNDHHSHLDETSTTLTLADAAGASQKVSLPLGGFARVAAAIQEVAASETNVIKLHAGDAITGDLYYTQSEGEADAVAMNTVCFDAMTIGNHEFDNGDAGLAKFIGYLHQNPDNCNTPILSSNLSAGSSSPITGKFAASTTVTRDGQTIGIVGVTTANKTMNASRPDADTTLSDEVASAQTAIDALRNQGVNKIILLSHAGYDFDMAILAPQLDGVDVIVGGDSHTLLGPTSLSGYGLSAAGDYPTKLTDKSGKPVCVAQAWQNAYEVGKLTVDFDKNGVVSSCEGTPMILVGDSYKVGGAEVSTADASAYSQNLANSGVFRVTQPAAATVQALQSYSDAKQAMGQVVVGATTENLCLRRVPGTGPKSDITRSSLGDICNNDPDVIAHGGNIQQLVAEAFLAQGQRYGGADIALQNGGGVRIDIPAGDISVGNVYTLLPFKNLLIRIPMTGQQIKDSLEEGIDSMLGNNNGTGSGAYPYTAGLRFNVDITQAKGARVSTLAFHQNGAWTAFDVSQTYRVITNDFTAGGGDNYLTLKAIDSNLKENTFLDYADAFLQYVKENPQLQKPAVGSYSTQSYTE